MKTTETENKGLVWQFFKVARSKGNLDVFDGLGSEFVAQTLAELGRALET